MTDRNDDYYQPWLRDPASTPDKAAKSTGAEGLAKPPADAPVGVDVTAYPIDEPAPPPRAGKPARPSETATTETLSALAQLRLTAQRFADWTIDAGTRADIPAKVERLELPRRARELGQQTGALTARAGRAIGRNASAGWGALSSTTAKGWRRLALPTHAARIAGRARAGLDVAADKTRSGLGNAAKAGIAGVSDAAGKATSKLRPAASPPEPPPSGLDQLLEREEAAAPAGKPAPDLPLFAADNHPPVAAPAAKQASAAAAAAVPSLATGKAAPLSAPQHPTGGDTGVAWQAGWPSIWWLAAGALTLAAVFWLGTRTGSGGMSKSEVETVVGDYILANPQIIPQAMEKFRANETAQAIDAIRPALEKPYSGAWAGNANGDVTITVFTDYGCVFCRASVPDIDRLLREDSGVKVVYRELPIIAPQSRDAAIMALRAARQGKYDAFHHAMFAAGSLESTAIAAAARKVGLVTDGSADATGSIAVLQRELESNLAIARQLQLNATPTWIIGDQLLQGAIGYDGLTAAVAKARKAKD